MSKRRAVADIDLQQGVIADELLDMGSATLYEASGIDCYLNPTFQPAWAGAQFVGRALPVLAASGDNLALHWALALARPGDVLVVDGGDEDCGYFGEVMAVAAQARGIAGVIIDGGVRDTRQLEALKFPVFSTRVAIRGTNKKWAGSIGPTLTLRGRPISRGDLVVADRDGIAVLPSSRISEVVEAARQRTAVEDAYMQRLREGELTLDVFGFRDIDEPLITTANPILLDPGNEVAK
ncbi:4-carboxy-4-hydroxy-2-oxoadipate aldolase/oxaloacetate decarboxylase [Arthrobacter sp. CDRTa11]|uniref:4-carboxy-4-hydroxy-2-oxoadipate aldolase/oxaloacetate decarboxylase n=1 Tax=Arthrobacter sp. CDRTa11 TaxID=2651199 RepID=UPI00226584BB|nr:4-carboxy-4-hydroxy-2-oxoadipate aldolase/oxaloacetate decarboxylase [Arthrobacter sp. CDRTa11]UZX02866.1 4-carboxy-4-hydroxy-2-oxoadipate aldolase/oxaloacetate decarboxylase [Arthrobacter sp. CDRTa11]